MFQLDGTPPYWRPFVRDCTDEGFLNRIRIGRGGPGIPWPPRSPDITPSEFFVWGFVKTIKFMLIKSPVWNK